MTRDRVNISVPHELAEAARRKSKETGVPVSFVIQRALLQWVETGEIAPEVAEGTTAPKEAKPKKPKVK